MLATVYVLGFLSVIVVSKAVIACVSIEREATHDGSSCCSEDDLRLARIYRNGRSA
jgi:hypothetical protein